MTIYRCDKCSREDGEEYPPCIFIPTLITSQIPEMCPYCTYRRTAIPADWVKCDKMPEDVTV